MSTNKTLTSRRRKTGQPCKGAGVGRPGNPPRHSAAAAAAAAVAAVATAAAAGRPGSHTCPGRGRLARGPGSRGD